MYTHKTIVVFGVSQDSSKYGHKIFTALVRQGLQVYGIHPKGGEVAGRTLFTDLKQVPTPVDVAVLVIPPTALEAAVQQCMEARIPEIWFQPGARSAQAFELATSAGIKAVNGCFMADNGFW